MEELEFLEEPKPKNEDSEGLSAGTIFLIVGLVAIALVFGIQLTRQNETQPDEGTLAFDFTFETYDHGTFSLSDYRGQVVLINIWGSWCGPCRAEAPDLEQIWQEYKDRGVMVVGIDWLDTERNGRAFIEEFGLTYPNGADIGEKIAEQYNIQGAPENFVIDKNGYVAEFIYGSIRLDTIRDTLDELLEKESA